MMQNNDDDDDDEYDIKTMKETILSLNSILVNELNKSIMKTDRKISLDFGNQVDNKLNVSSNILAPNMQY